MDKHLFIIIRQTLECSGEQKGRVENMSRVEKSSSLQIMLLIAFSRLITSYAYIPIVNTPPVNQDMWIALILSGIYTIIICAPILYLSSLFSDMTPVECSEKILGKAVGYIQTHILLVEP